MKNATLAAFLFIAQGLLESAAQEPKAEEPAAKWQVLALRIGKTEPNYKLGVLTSGTNVITKLELPKRYVVMLEPNACKIETFADDKNTDLLKTPFRNGPREPVQKDIFDMSSGDHMRVEFNAQGTPAPGATKIRIKGVIAVLVGKDEKEVALADLKVGTLTLPKKNKGFNAFLGESGYVGSRPLKAVVMTDPAGKDVHFQVRNRYDPKALDGKGGYRASVAPGKAEINRDKIRVTYFDTVEKIMVPIDLEFGPGL